MATLPAVWIPDTSQELRVEAGGKQTKAGVQHPAIADLSDQTGGTAGNTIGPTGNQGLDDNFASLTAKINAILDAIRGVGIIP